MPVLPLGQGDRTVKSKRRRALNGVALPEPAPNGEAAAEPGPLEGGAVVEAVAEAAACAELIWPIDQDGERGPIKGYKHIYAYNLL